MHGVPTHEELEQRVRELEHRAVQPRHPEDSLVWEHLFSQAVMDNLPAGFAYFNQDFVLLKCNRVYADFLRIHTPYDVEQARGMCHFDYKPGSRPYLGDWFFTVRDFVRPETRYELELWITRDGKPHVSYWDAHLTPVLGPDKRFQGVLMCCLDVTERIVMKRALEEKEERLASELRNTEELKTALKVLLKLREEDKKGLEKKLLVNVNQMLLPWIEKLKQTRLDSEQRLCLEALESNVKEVVSPFCKELTLTCGGLTPTEIQVANLVKQGKTSKEIAFVLRVSKDCVDFHRNNIRKKLGLTRKKANLRTYLSELTP